MLFLTLLFALSALTSAQDDVCDVNMGGISEGGKDLPVIPKSYETKVEVFDALFNRFQFVEEKFDGTGSNVRGAFQILYNGSEYGFIYNKTKVYRIYNEDSSVFKVHTTCALENLNLNHLNFMYLSSNVTSGEQHINLGMGLLNFNNGQIKFRYVEGGTMVRGMWADVWSSCHEIPAIAGKFNIRIMWSVSTEDAPLFTADGYEPIPLQMIVIGKYKTHLGDKDYKNVNLIFNYLWFKSNPALDEEDFQPPLGVYCSDGVLDNSFPNIPSIISTRVETIVEMEHIPEDVMYVDLWMDDEWQLIKSEFSLPSEQLQFFNSSRIVTIADWKADIQYTLDEYGTICRFGPTPKLDNNLSPTSPHDDFFGTISNWEYQGKYKIREVLCDCWVGRHDEDSAAEWCFLDKNWKDEEDGIEERRTPIRYRQFSHKKTGKPLVRTQNYFKFEGNPKGFPFEIAPCYQPNQQRRFQFHFKGLDDVNLNTDDISVSARFALAKFAHVSPLRVSQVETIFDLESGFIFIQFSILDKLSKNNDDPNDVSKEDAAIALASVVSAGNLVVNIPHSKLNLVAEKDSLFEIVDTIRGSFSHFGRLISPGLNTDLALDARAKVNTLDNMDKYSTGQLAGLAVGMFILGGTLGVIAMLLLLLRIDRNRREGDTLQLTQDTPVQVSPVTECSVD